MDIISFSKAKKAQQKADDVQNQLNQAISAGDPLSETAQARVDTKGNTYTTLKERLDEKESSFSAQLAENVQYKSNIFWERLKNKSITKIKLIGDSITAGVGGSFYEVPTDGRVILTKTNGIPEREASHTSTSWANMFRQFITNHDATIDFLNAGIGGWSTLTFEPYWDQIATNDDDVVFVMLGTNDRQYLLSEYKQRITDFLEYINTKANTMIVMCAPPSQSDFNTDGTYQYIFGTKEIDNTLQEICNDNGYTYISHYKEMLDYCYKSNVDITYLMQEAGSHPNDNGYKFMWKTIQNKLNFIDTSLNWRTKDENRNLSVKLESEVIGITDLNLSRFPLGTSLWVITSAKATELGLPSAGLLTTHIVSKTSPYATYNMQYFNRIDNGKIYTRSYGDVSWDTTWRAPEENVYTLTNHNLPLCEITNYAVGTNYAIVSTGEASTHSLPEKTAGLLITIRARSTNDGYSRQIYLIYGSTNVYSRTYYSDSGWGKWIGMGDYYENYRFPIDEPVTSYGSLQTTYSVYNIADANAPEGKAGVLVTTRTPREYSYQEYWIYAEVTKYRRFWYNSGNWSAWTKITP